MKLIILILLFFSTSHLCVAGFYTNISSTNTAKLKKAKKDYTLGNIHFFSAYSSSSGTYLPQSEASLSNSLKGTIGRWDWIMPLDGMYCYTDGLALLGGFKGYYPSGGFLEAGLGWMFGKSNKRARESKNFVRFQGGMGLGFGIRGLGFNKSHYTTYGAIWPEFAAIVNIGNHFTVHPKYSYFPMINNGLWGLRSNAEMLIAYRFIGWLGFTARFQAESLRFDDEVPAWNGKQFTGKAKIQSLQLGISIHSRN